MKQLTIILSLANNNLILTDYEQVRHLSPRIKVIIATFRPLVLGRMDRIFKERVKVGVVLIWIFLNAGGIMKLSEPLIGFVESRHILQSVSI